MDKSGSYIWLNAGLTTKVLVLRETDLILAETVIQNSIV